MIDKIKSIDNFAVFDGFRWDSCVKNSDGQVLSFDKLNIIYGRNYSGKTTLSRIIRTMETGVLPEKYNNPQFEVRLKDGQIVNQTSVSHHNLAVRVFNEDFVRQNLRFLIDSDSEIKPFAILGADNSVLEREISSLEATLGSSEPNQESGKYLELKTAKGEANDVKSKYDEKIAEKDKKLSNKATDKTIGIKYNTDKFGTQVQNYNITKLNDDIDKVMASTYIDLTQKEKGAHDKTILEQAKNVIYKTPSPQLSFSQYIHEAAEMLSREIGASSKIQKLLHDAALNEWVKTGVKLHNDINVCVFCDNKITEERWKVLHSHFDEESKKLENDIESLITRINSEITIVSQPLSVDKSLFYSSYHDNIDSTVDEYNAISVQYTACLRQILNQLEKRKISITTTTDFIEPVNHIDALKNAFIKYINICEENDDYTGKIGKIKTAAQLALRLQDVKDYCVAIGYKKMLSDIAALESEMLRENNKVKVLQNDIDATERMIKEKRRLMNDEEAGAIKVNEYLTNYFGHSFLTLQAERVDDGEVRIRFGIFRENEPAFNLSEGECGLIAFCYFIAKLDDVDTRGVNPIIWIDDPVSSLDSNHVFFVYSLVLAEVVKKNTFSQLFVSTHNLDFLKYLKRLNAFANQGGIGKRYLIVNRRIETSSIEVMPNYLRDYATEYNFLFSRILYCSRIQNVDDSNFDLIANFGSTARRFLEIHLYFKFPDIDDDSKIRRFFANDEIAAELVNRLCNEGSHGSLEQAQRMSELPEVVPVAKKIIDKLQEDIDQFNSLLMSIDEQPIQS